MPYMRFECKSCIISSQLYIHPIIFFKQNLLKKSEDTPGNFTLGIYSIFKELLTLLLTNNPDTRLRAQCKPQYFSPMQDNIQSVYITKNRTDSRWLSII